MQSGMSTLEAVLNDRLRLEALNKTGLLDSAPESVFDRLTEEVCKKLHVPFCALTLVEPHRQFLKSHYGLAEDIRNMDIKYSLCQHVVHEGGAIVINDANENEKFRDHPAVQEKGIVSYLGVPLVHEGCVIGGLCAADTKPRVWKQEDIIFMENQSLMARLELFVRRRPSH